MATYYARKAGNVNAADVWATTPTGTASDVFSSFTNEDVLVTNNFSITINVDTTVMEIRNDATGGATAGGSITINNNITLTSNLIAFTALVTVPVSSSVTIIGDIYGPTISSGYANTLNLGTSSTTNIIGNLYGPTAGSSNVIAIFGGGTIVNITGNLYAGSGSPTSSSVIYVHPNGGPIINITGNLIAPQQAPAGTIINGSSGTFTITGYVSNILIYGGLVTIYGDVLGSNAANVPGVNCLGGVVNIYGLAIGGDRGVGVSNNGGTVNIKRAKGNNFGPSAVGLTSCVGVSSSQTSITRVEEIEYGLLGQSPTSGPIILADLSSNVAIFAVRNSLPKTLVDSSGVFGSIPASGDVRNGVIYNLGNSSGICVIPHPNSVVYGVPVDNTTGSGLISSQAVWNVLSSSISESGSIGQRLKNCSTVATVGKQLEGAL